MKPVARPILFSAPMVRALLEGRKTQTRRVVKPQPPANVMSAGVIHSESTSDGLWSWLDSDSLLDASIVGDDFRCPYGKPGDLLYVKEAWARRLDEDHLKGSDIPVDRRWAWYWADPNTCNTGCAGAAGRKRAARFMPRWASRITLKITDVRVERLQDISEEDTDAEGFGGDYPEKVMPDVFPPRDGGWGHLSIIECYQRLWESINGAGSWAANPWVFALTFTVEHRNVDDVLREAL